MTAPGTRRAIYDQKSGTDKCDNSTMSLQMGYTQGANQSGQNFGLGRQIYDAKYCPKGESSATQEGADATGYMDYQDEGYQGYQDDGQDYWMGVRWNENLKESNHFLVNKRAKTCH